jgi:hypothetical protein
MKKYYEVMQMANLKEESINYVTPTTKNISELDKVPVDAEVFDKVVNEGQPDEFRYQYIKADDVEYRLPSSVKKQLKAHLQANPDLMYFSVNKQGEGIKTEYTVIPLSE